MPRQIPGRQLPPVTGGTVNQVQCPHCGKPNDYRELQSQQLMDTGSDCECDHCHRFMEIVAILPVTYVQVRQSPRRTHAAAPQQTVRQATTISPAAAQRMLGTPRGRR